MPDFRMSGSFGKRQEYIVAAELLKRGFDVYMTLVDDQQIDCVVRINVRAQPMYLDVQIKARSLTAKQPGMFAAMEIRAPRPNFVYIFYSEAADQYWIMPSMVLADLAIRNRTGKNAGRYSITFASRLRGGEIRVNPRFDEWRMNWTVLTAMAEALRSVE